MEIEKNAERALDSNHQLHSSAQRANLIPCVLDLTLSDSLDSSWPSVSVEV